MRVYRKWLFVLWSRSKLFSCPKDSLEHCGTPSNVGGKLRSLVKAFLQKMKAKIVLAPANENEDLRNSNACAIVDAFEEMNGD